MTQISGTVFDWISLKPNQKPVPVIYCFFLNIWLMLLR